MSAAEDYQVLISRLRSALPDVARQVEEEVRRGRVATRGDLRQEEEYQERARRLAETRLPPLDANDVAAVPYRDEQRIELIREALVTLAETMSATRHAVLDLARRHVVAEGVRFGDPDQEETRMVNLEMEAASADETLQGVRFLLGHRRPGEEPR